jgi:KipI family sensor histidine kinase inhibitor
VPAILCFGDSAVLVDAPSAEPRELVHALRQLEDVEEVLPGPLVCVRAKPGGGRALASAAAVVATRAEQSLAAIRSPSGSEPIASPQPQREISIPVVFDGPDLEQVVSAAGLSAHQVIESLRDARLQVAYLGFSPGFAYVTGLPESLAELPRRDSPRTSVPSGSVGIAGGYLGIYPQSSPGGWNLVGRTDVQLFDPEQAPYSTLQPGDLLKLVPTEELGPPRPWAEPSPRPRSRSSRWIEVIDPGVLTTLQDAGRIGVAHLGVPGAGPADRDSMRLANRVAGNPEHFGALETTMSGPTLRFNETAYAVVVGAAIELDGRTAEPGVVFEVPANGRLHIGGSQQLRGYLAVSGGIEGPELFGSFSSDLLCGLGPGPLQVGDQLDFGESGTPRGYTAQSLRSLSLRATVRVIPGPAQVDREALMEWVTEPFEVSPESNRVGVRLRGPRPIELEDAPRGSHGMVPGAVQIPPSGEPIVLLCDHATMGGYPVVATVISADLGVIAQRRPGEPVQFEIVDLEQAIEALKVLDRQLANAPTGIYPTGPVD